MIEKNAGPTVPFVDGYRVVHRDNDGNVPGDLDWYVEQEGNYDPVGQHPTEAKAELFRQHRLEWEKGLRPRPAANDSLYQ